jgi:hypothetical protein
MQIHIIKRLFGIAVVVLLLSFVFVIRPAQANGDGHLSLSYSISLEGDLVIAGVGLRGSGTGDIVVSGIPAGASVRKALLYWATIGTQDTFTSPTLDGQSVTGKLIGTAADTCWYATGNFVYRAEVTSLVSRNGTYSIAGLPALGHFDNDSQGAALVVVYSAPGTARKTILINDGAVTLDLEKHTYTDTIQGFVPDDPLTSAQITYIVGDGQSWLDGDITLNGSVLDTSAFTGSDGDYWDTLSYDVTGLAPTPLSTTTIDDYYAPADVTDCLLWVATVFSVTSVELENQSYLPLTVR